MSSIWDYTPIGAAWNFQKSNANRLTNFFKDPFGMNSARQADAQRQQDLIDRQLEAARMQREKLDQNRRNTKAREGAVRQRGQALRGQMRSRSRARPRGGTILTSGTPFGNSIIGGGNMGQTSIIGG